MQYLDKMMEYTSKSLNKELQLTVAEMPSSMRYLFGDQKFLNTMDTMKQYNEITDKMCGEMEGILQTSLDLDKAEKIIKERIASGSNFSDPTSQDATTTTDSGTGQVTGSSAADRLQVSRGGVKNS